MIKKLVQTILLVNAVVIGLLFILPGQQARGIAAGFAIFIVVLHVVESMLLYSSDPNDQ